jgi:tetratricopeptide (TPR) repeat protein
MKKCALWISCAILCMFLISCSSYESQADKAYSQSKNTQGYDKKILEKRAYIFYQRVLKATPDKRKLSLSMRQRFLEITMNRAYMVLNEGSYDMDAIHLFMEDLDSILTKDSPAELRQRYSDFLSQMGDSCLSRGQVDESLKWLTKAMNYVDNTSSLQDKKKRIVNDYSKQYFDMANDAYKQSKEDKDPELAVKAEYYVQLAMVYDPALPGAAALLSELRKININTFSGYAKMVEGKLDKRVNKYDILLAVAKTKAGYTVSMFNNSYNPQRLKPEFFFLVDEKGQKYKAAPSSKIDPEILDTQHDTKGIKLFIPGAPAVAKKLVYENGEHYSEKLFF